MKRLEWVDSEVKVIKIFFARVANGESVHSAARYLHQQGYRNRNGKAFDKAFLYKIIRRQIYCDGIYRWNGIESEKPIIEPFIDLATWEKANRVIASVRSPATGKKRISSRDDSPYVLQGVLKCKRCGGKMMGHVARLGVRYYVCATYASKTKEACLGQWIKAEPIEEEARDILKITVSDRYILELSKQQIRQAMAERNPDLLKGIRLAEKQIREIEAHTKKLLDLHYRDAVNLEQFKEENSRLLQEKSVILKSQEQLQCRLDLLQNQSANVEKIFGILENFDTIYGKLDNRAKKNLYNCVFLFAHATACRGQPTKLGDYELNEAFKVLLRLREQWTKNQQNLSKIQEEVSSIRSSPTAAR